MKLMEGNIEAEFELRKKIQTSNSEVDSLIRDSSVMNSDLLRRIKEKAQLSQTSTGFSTGVKKMGTTANRNMPQDMSKSFISQVETSALNRTNTSYKKTIGKTRQQSTQQRNNQNDSSTILDDSAYSEYQEMDDDDFIGTNQKLTSTLSYIPDVDK